MSNTRKKLDGGVRINPNTDALVNDGDINIDSSDNKLKVKLGGTDKTVATEDLVASINTITEWTDFTPTASAGWGTITGATGKWRRVGDSMEVVVNFVSGTVSASLAEVYLPSGYVIDTSKVDSSKTLAGMWNLTDGTNNFWTSGFSGVFFYDGTNTDRVGMTYGSTSAGSYDTRNVSSFATSSDGVNGRFTVPILGWSSASSFVMTPAQSTLTDWADYTPTGGWTGSVSYTGKWRRVGENMEVAVTVSLSGAPTGSDLSIDLPSGYSIDTSKIPSSTTSVSYFGAGTIHDNGSSTEPLSVRYFSTTAVRLVSDRTTSAVITPTAPFTFASGDSVEVLFSVPISGWDSTAQFLAAVPLPKSAIVSEIQPNTTSSTTSLSANTFSTNTLNDIEGDSSFLSVSSNQITLQPGTYRVNCTIPVYANAGAGVVTDMVARFRNITDSSTVRTSDGASVRADGNDIICNKLDIKTQFTITSAKTYEVQTRVSQTSGITIGRVASAGEDEVYTQLEIVQIYE